MIECALDTSVIIDLIKGSTGVGRLIGRYARLGISHVVLGELLLGRHKAAHPNETFKIIEALKGITVLSADAITAEIYAQIRFELEKQGKPIPQNDIWIAATALLINVPLITCDQHFRRIPQLKVLEY